MRLAAALAVVAASLAAADARLGAALAVLHWESADAAITDAAVAAAEVVLAVPQRDGLRAAEPDGAPGVDVVEGAGEGDDAEPHATPAATSVTIS